MCFKIVGRNSLPQFAGYVSTLSPFYLHWMSVFAELSAHSRKFSVYLLFLVTMNKILGRFRKHRTEFFVSVWLHDKSFPPSSSSSSSSSLHSGKFNMQYGRRILDSLKHSKKLCSLMNYFEFFPVGTHAKNKTVTTKSILTKAFQ